MEILRNSRNFRGRRRSIILDRVLLSLKNCAYEEGCFTSSADMKTARRWPYYVTRRLLTFTLQAENRGGVDFIPNVPRDGWQWHSCHNHFHSMEVFAKYDVLGQFLPVINFVCLFVSQLTTVSVSDSDGASDDSLSFNVRVNVSVSISVSASVSISVSVSVSVSINVSVSASVSVSVSVSASVNDSVILVIISNSIAESKFMYIILAGTYLSDDDGDPIAQGHKASFCLEDTKCDDGIARKWNCTGGQPQGISPNCYDIYKRNIDCQWVDLSDIRHGYYFLRIHLNPESKVAETDYENNVGICEIYDYGEVATVGHCHQGIKHSVFCNQRNSSLFGKGLFRHVFKPFPYLGGGSSVHVFKSCPYLGRGSSVHVFKPCPYLGRGSSVHVFKPCPYLGRSSSNHVFKPCPYFGRGTSSTCSNPVPIWEGALPSTCSNPVPIWEGALPSTCSNPVPIWEGALPPRVQTLSLFGRGLFRPRVQSLSLFGKGLFRPRVQTLSLFGKGLFRPRVQTLSLFQTKQKK